MLIGAHVSIQAQKRRSRCRKPIRFLGKVLSDGLEHACVGSAHGSLTALSSGHLKYSGMAISMLEILISSFGPPKCPNARV